MLLAIAIVGTNEWMMMLRGLFLFFIFQPFPLPTTTRLAHTHPSLSTHPHLLTPLHPPRLTQGKNVYYSGRAGSGKSHLLRAIIERAPAGKTFITASTGIAAINVGGTSRPLSLLSSLLCSFVLPVSFQSVSLLLFHAYLSALAKRIHLRSSLPPSPQAPPFIPLRASASVTTPWKS